MRELIKMLLRFAVVAVLLETTAAWGWGGSAAPAPVQADPVDLHTTTDQVAEDSEPFSCGAQLRLPTNYPANLTIGVPPEKDQTLDDLRAQGYQYAEYMRAQGGGNGGGALGAKFRNFRKEALEMYWCVQLEIPSHHLRQKHGDKLIFSVCRDDGTEPGMYSGKVSAMGRTATTS